MLFLHNSYVGVDLYMRRSALARGGILFIRNIRWLMIKKFFLGFVIIGFVAVLASILITTPEKKNIELSSVEQARVIADDISKRIEGQTEKRERVGGDVGADQNSLSSYFDRTLFSKFFGGKYKVSFDVKITSLDEDANLKREIEADEKTRLTERKKQAQEAREKLREEALKRVDENAPGAFKDIVLGVRTNDMVTAELAADAFVDYMINLMFEVQQITDLIIKALIKRELVDEAEVAGAGQYVEYNLARAREAQGAIIKPMHKDAMARIIPDPEHEAQIYYFFTLSCTYCREMAADIERLWRMVQKDDRVKMTALTMSKEVDEWIESYRDYTGLTVPIEEGAESARNFGIGFIPALVIISPNNNQAYTKSGEQSFLRMYEFLRTVQGLEFEVTEEMKELMKEKIGNM